MQIDYMDLIEALFSDVNPIPVKTAMRMLGYEVGELRLPLCEMEETKNAAMRKALSRHKLLLSE